MLPIESKYCSQFQDTLLVPQDVLVTLELLLNQLVLDGLLAGDYQLGVGVMAAEDRGVLVFQQRT